MMTDWTLHSDEIAALDWQIELGADEAISDTPVNWFDIGAQPAPAPQAELPPRKMAATPRQPAPEDVESAEAEKAVMTARQLAAGCQSLEALREAMEGFEGCSLKKGARSTVFADGNPAADLMIIGEAPGREEDRIGKPFVGRSGQLLDRMMAAIGRDRSNPDPAKSVYITNVLPWRPPQNRDPSSDEKLMLHAFTMRHIELAAPKVLLLMGNASAKSLLDTTTGITRLRGDWHAVEGIPAMPTFHPAALLRNPAQKAHSWKDLLSVKDKLETLP